MRRQVEKLIANQGLEAVREVLSHLQVWSMDLEMQGVERPPFLVNDYRRTRRLRDYLSVQVESAQLPEFELEPGDADLLTACCLFAAENIESAMLGGEVSQDREWAQQSMRNLSMLAFEFAISPVSLIQGPGRREAPPPEVQSMMRLINDKVRPSFSSGAGEPPSSSIEPLGYDPHGAGDENFPVQGGPAPVQPLPGYSQQSSPEPPPGHPPTQQSISQSRASQRPDDLADEDWNGGWGGERNPLPPPGSSAPPTLPGRAAPAAPARGSYFGSQTPARPRNPAAPHPGGAAPRPAPAVGRGAAGGMHPASASAAPGEAHTAHLDFDIQRLKDPRLRSIMQLDLKALSRASEAQDQRMRAVHLSSIFEGMVVDVALQRRSELGLRGTPEAWQLQKIVSVLLGERLAGTDRNTMHHLVNCKDLVRPGVQLVNPLVVTRQTVDKMAEFVQRFLQSVGLAQSG